MFAENFMEEGVCVRVRGGFHELQCEKLNIKPMSIFLAICGLISILVKILFSE